MSEHNDEIITSFTAEIGRLQELLLRPHLRGGIQEVLRDEGERGWRRPIRDDT